MILIYNPYYTYPSIYSYIHRIFGIHLVNMNSNNIILRKLVLFEKSYQLVIGIKRKIANFKLFYKSRINKVGIMNLKLQTIC